MFLSSRLAENFRLGELVIGISDALWFCELSTEVYVKHSIGSSVCCVCWMGTVLILSFPPAFKTELKQLCFYN